MNSFDIKKILIPTDFSDTSLKALDHAILLSKLTKAEITLLHVMENITATAYLAGRLEDTAVDISALEKDSLEYRKEHMKQFVKTLKTDNQVKVSPLIVTGRTHIEIVKAAKKLKADMIVMGTHGVSGIREFLVGSNTFRVVNDSECPVLSVQSHTSNPGFKNILVPFSDQPHSREKVMHAIRIAKLFNSTLSIIGIDTEQTKSHSRKIELETEQIREIAENRHGVKCNTHIYSEGFYAELVLRHAKETSADLITIMSQENQTSITDFFRKAFVERIVNHSPIPVLSIRPTFNTDLIDMRFY